MRLDRLTNKTREALLAAQQLAEERGHPELYPEHLLVRLIGQKDGVASTMLTKAGVDPRAVAERATKALASKPSVSKIFLRSSVICQTTRNFSHIAQSLGGNGDKRRGTQLGLGLSCRQLLLFDGRLTW